MLSADGGDGERAQLSRLVMSKTCPSDVDLHNLHFRLTILLAGIELHAGARCERARTKR
ncbi:hypothetical protein KGO5_06134 [Sinorhizobium sp. KGO-5]|nr:hypothetical protein KGO5_06134 [Sinorhizobium sp. KGO-5]